MLDGFHAINIAYNLNSHVFSGLQAHEATQLNDALESLDVDLGGFQLVIDKRLPVQQLSGLEASSTPLLSSMNLTARRVETLKSA
jgi:hypothetical protein